MSSMSVSGKHGSIMQGLQASALTRMHGADLGSELGLHEVMTYGDQAAALEPFRLGWKSSEDMYDAWPGETMERRSQVE